jgi:hypothetical protein
MNKLILIAAALLASCGDDVSGDNRNPKDQEPRNYGWSAGPVINGQNYSVGVKLIDNFDGTSEFQFPGLGGHVNYITKPYGSLASATRIRMTYRIEIEGDGKLVPKCCPNSLAQGPTIYFATKDNDWRKDGQRWWATFDAKTPMVAGTYEVVAPFTSRWTSVLNMDSDDNHAEFAEALRNADRIGFTFGGGDGFGHGVYATTPAKFTMLEFKVE